MADMMTAFKAEISRLARKEIKVALQATQKTFVVLRKSIGDLKKRIDELDRQNKQLKKTARKVAPIVAATSASAVNVGEAGKAKKVKQWISGKGVRSLRKRLRLSQDEFARLVGVTINGVGKWERKEGMLQLRTRTKEALMAIRDITAGQAKAKLAELSPAAPVAEEVAETPKKRVKKVSKKSAEKN